MDKCNIIRDLLPLYVDNVCSEDSRILIEEHLESCKACRRELEEMQAELAIEAVGEPEEIAAEKEEAKLLLEGKKALEDKVWKDYQMGAGILDIILNFGIFVWCIYASATFGYEAVTKDMLAQYDPFIGLLEGKIMLLMQGFLYVFFFVWELVYLLKYGLKNRKGIFGEVIMYSLCTKFAYLVLFCIVGAVFLGSMLL